MPKRTYSPSKRKKIKRQGFMSKNRSKSGTKVIKRRILKGRKRIV